MQGFAAGIMIAASFWSLLEPAIESSKGSSVPWLPAAIGFILGGFFIRALDYVIPHIHQNAQDKNQQREGVKTSLGKIHYLYYNYATQYSRGIINWCSVWGVVSGNGQATFLGAIGLAIGIGIQNIPEGAALSMPIRAAGASRLKSFNYGQASAIVEPILQQLVQLLS